jgi:hypothetical protein
MTPIEQCPQIYQTLAVHVASLSALLREPEPGLWSWAECVAQEAAAIAKLYAGAPEYISLDDFAPPIRDKSEFRHMFDPGCDPKSCWRCGAGKLHAIHQGGTHAR